MIAGIPTVTKLDSRSVVLLLFLLSVRSKDHPDHNRSFIPTHDWQQVIPASLYIQYESGINSTEARLVGEDVLNATYGGYSGTKQTYQLQLRSNQSSLLEDRSLDSTVPSRQTHSFRSYAELKSEFEALNIATKTEADLMDMLFDDLTKPGATNLASILQDLIYLLHQVDNAKDFADKKRLRTLITYMHHNDPEVRKLARSALGAAIQSNPKVQIAALQSGLLHEISTILRTTVSLNTNTKSVLGYLVTLGALLRHFTYAQSQFFGHNVPTDASSSAYALLADLSQTERWFNRPALARKIRIRVLTLITDIYNERRVERNAERQKQYADVPFEESLVAIGWCDQVMHALMTDLRSNTAESVDHDAREKLLIAANTSATLCASTMHHNQSALTVLDAELRLLEQEYQAKSADETEGDDYFGSLLRLVRQLRGHFSSVLATMNLQEL